MGYGAHRANIFTYHTGNITWRIHCNGVKVRNESGILRTYGNAGATVYAGVPAYLKGNGRFLFHRNLNLFVNR